MTCTDATTCLYCNQGSSSPYIQDGLCVAACLPGQIAPSQTKICRNSCNYKCDSDFGCTGSTPADCGKCAKGTVYNPANGTCYDLCPSGTGMIPPVAPDEFGTCVPCANPSALTCNGLNPNLTLRCPGAEVIQPDNLSCANACPGGNWIIENPHRRCLPCNAACSSCYGGMIGECSSCVYGYNLVGSSCHSNCSVGQYEAPPGFCTGCHAACGGAAGYCYNSGPT